MEMEVDDENAKAIDIDECDLYRPEGFTTVALENNNEIGRLCAIRKLDHSTRSRRLFFLEFYNTMNKPHIVLDWKYASKKVTFESMIWLGNFAVVGCSDGSLLMVSPFNYKTKRFPICVSSIVSVVAISASQIAIGSESSEVKLVELNLNDDLIVTKTIKFTSDQRVVSLAASLKFSCLAVGLIGEIILVQIPSGDQSSIKVPQQANKPTIVWTLLFVEDFLLSGDSRGKVMIHNPKTGALIKIIHSHQADILAMTQSAKKVYVSGTDYRIQILGQVTSGNDKLEWNTIGQRIFHENDIRCLARVGQFLVSGGAEHRILVSNRHYNIFNVENRPSCSVSADGSLLLIPYSDRIELWKLPSSNAPASCYGDISIFDSKSGPKLLTKITFKTNAVILKAILSPDGQYVIASTDRSLNAYKLRLCPDGKYNTRPIMSIPFEEPVMALHATNSAFYFAHGTSILEQVDFETLSRKVLAVRESDAMIINIVVDSSNTRCLALTTRSEMLFVDFNSGLETDERFEDLQLSYVPTDFKFHVTKKGDPLAVFIICGFNTRLVLFNLKTREEMKTPIELKGFVGKRSIITSASNVVDNSIALQETRGKHCIVGELNGVQSVVFSSHQNRKMLTEESKIVLPPFPFEVHYTANESGSTSVLSISSEPENPPTWTPINIQRFNRQ